jgi:chemotaxis signal transduction protein
MSSSSEQQSLERSVSLPELNIQDLEQMDDEEFWKYARRRAHSVPESPSHTEYLECKLSGKACLVALRDLAEVLPPPHRFARLPGMPTWMAGIMAWRGETIAVVNLDLYLLQNSDADLSRMTDGMLLMLHSTERTLGLLVPALGFTSTIETEQVLPPDDSAGFVLSGNSSIVAGIYQDVPILNISALLAGLVQQIGMATSHG